MLHCMSQSQQLAAAEAAAVEASQLRHVELPRLEAAAASRASGLEAELGRQRDVVTCLQAELRAKEEQVSSRAMDEKIVSEQC